MRQRPFADVLHAEKRDAEVGPVHLPSQFGAHGDPLALGLHDVAEVVEPSIGDGVAELLEALDVEGDVVVAESYDPGSSDFRTQLTKIVSARPTAVFIVGYSELSQALIQAKEMDIQTTFIGTGLLEDPNILQTARDAAEGVLFTQLGYDPASDDSVVSEYVESYKQEFGEESNIIAAYGYDALSVLAFAINRSDNSSVDIKKQLYAVRGYQGVTGEITFDENGDVTQPMGVKKIENGEFVWISHVIQSNK